MKAVNPEIVAINDLAAKYAYNPAQVVDDSEYARIQSYYVANESSLINSIQAADLRKESSRINLMRNYVGGLSQPSKMPWYSWSTPAVFCETGSKLAEIENSTCSGCYAKSGNYLFTTSRTALLRRWLCYKLSPIVWFHAFNRFFQAYDSSSVYHFRWFDSGDLASKSQGSFIAQLATNNKHVKFWLPTRERSYVPDNSPDNLIIRYSSPMIDTLSKLPNSTGVISDSRNLSRSLQIVGNRNDVGYCPATTTNEHTCNAHQCRACWQPGHILYQLH